MWPWPLPLPCAGEVARTFGGLIVPVQACDMCRKKKIKCDGKMPKCSHCINYKTDCVFTQVEKKRNPPKG